MEPERVTSLFKLAKESVKSHQAGLLGLIAFEYVAFKDSLSRVPVEFKNLQNVVPLCLLISTVLFTVTACWASAMYMLVDYARRIAIEKARGKGLGLQLDLENLKSRWLGFMTILLAGINAVLLLLDLGSNMLREMNERNISFAEIFRELLFRTFPLVIYVMDLANLAHSPRVFWSDCQALCHNPRSMEQFLSQETAEFSAMHRSDKPCPRTYQALKATWQRMMGSRAAPEGIELRSMGLEEVEEVEADVLRTLSQGVAKGSWERLLGADVSLLRTRHLQALLADRKGAFSVHVLVAVLLLLFLVLAPQLLLPALYRSAFVPQLLGVDAFHAQLQRRIKVHGRHSTHVDLWLVPDEGSQEISLLWRPDLTMASRFTLFRAGMESMTLHHRHRMSAAAEPFVTSLPPSTFGAMSYFRMNGFFERQVNLVVLGVQEFWFHVGDLLYEGRFYHQETWQDDYHPEIQFHVQADWKLLELVAVRAQLDVLDKELQVSSSEDLQCSALCQLGACVVRCGHLSRMRCGTSCNVHLHYAVRPMAALGIDLQRPDLATVKIRDLEGRYLEVVLEAQEKVMAEMNKQDPTLLDVKMSDRDKLLEKAYLERKGEVNAASRSVLLTGLTGAGKSSTCFILLGQCNFSNSLESHTKSLSKVQGHVFGDASQPSLSLYDIPGFGDTEGAEADEAQWNETQRQLQDEGLDAIVWIVNGGIRRNLAVRQAMMQHYRKSFGPLLYDFLTVMINFVPKTTIMAHTVTMEQWKVELRGLMLAEENRTLGVHFEMLKERVVEAIQDKLSIYVVDLNPEYVETQRLTVPLSAPVVARMPPFSSPMNLPGLLSFVRHVTYKQSFREVWRQQMDCPRMGFGVLHSQTELHFCNRTDGATARVMVRGRYLGPGDSLLVQDAESPCGAAKTWLRLEAVNASIGEELHFSSPELAEFLEADAKFCFCEAPNCEVRRHCQEAARWSREKLDYWVQSTEATGWCSGWGSSTPAVSENDSPSRKPLVLLSAEIYGVDDEMMEDIAWGLDDNRLQEVKISESCISDEGLALLARRLPMCKGLRSLDLSHNCISDRGAVALAEQLPRCSLYHLNLSYNSLGDYGVAALRKACAHCTIEVQENGLRLAAGLGCEVGMSFKEGRCTSALNLSLCEASESEAPREPCVSSTAATAVRSENFLGFVEEGLPKLLKVIRHVEGRGFGKVPNSVEGLRKMRVNPWSYSEAIYEAQVVSSLELRGDLGDELDEQVIRKIQFGRTFLGVLTVESTIREDRESLRKRVEEDFPGGILEAFRAGRGSLVRALKKSAVDKNFRISIYSATQGQGHENLDEALNAHADSAQFLWEAHERWQASDAALLSVSLGLSRSEQPWLSSETLERVEEELTRAAWLHSSATAARDPINAFAFCSEMPESELNMLEQQEVWAESRKNQFQVMIFERLLDLQEAFQGPDGLRYFRAKEKLQMVDEAWHGLIQRAREVEACWVYLGCGRSSRESRGKKLKPSKNKFLKAAQSAESGHFQYLGICGQSSGGLNDLDPFSLDISYSPASECARRYEDRRCWDNNHRFCGGDLVGFTIICDWYRQLPGS